MRDVGGAQRRIIWILQRFCEDHRPFYPLPDFNSPFKRQLTIRNFFHRGRERLGSDAAIESVVPFEETRGLMVDFTLYKSKRSKADLDSLGGMESGTTFLAETDLGAVRRLVEMGKAGVLEFIKALKAPAESGAAFKP